MLRWIYLVLGIVAHGMFLLVFAYMAGFVGNFVVPKSIDAPALPGQSVLLAVSINLALLVMFALPHSIMARPAFKSWWTQYIPKPIERTVYVLTSNVLMIALLLFWRPIDAVIYDVQNPIGRTALWALFATGWFLVPLASLMINHFDLFGTRQVWLHLRGKVDAAMPFHTPMLYRFVRHPLYVGWMIAFWATPTLTAGHALFAAVLTAYMLVAIPFEERDLITQFGDQYVNYRRNVGGLVPRWPTRAFVAPKVRMEIKTF